MAPPAPPLPVRGQWHFGYHGSEVDILNSSYGSTHYAERNGHSERDVYSEIGPQILRRELSSDGNEEDESGESFCTLSESQESESESIPTRVAVLASADTVALLQVSLLGFLLLSSP